CTWATSWRSASSASGPRRGGSRRCCGRDSRPVRLVRSVPSSAGWGVAWDSGRGAAGVLSGPPPQPARRLHLRAYPWEAGVVGQRMFVSVVPPEDVVADLAEFVAPREGMPWIDPAQWHLTLAFMASVPEARQDELIDRLGEAAARVAPFDVV